MSEYAPDLFYWSAPSMKVIPHPIVGGFFRQRDKLIVLERVGDRFVDVRGEDDHGADGWVPMFYDLTSFSRARCSCVSSMISFSPSITERAIELRKACCACRFGSR